MIKTYPPLDGAASSSSLQTRSADEEETSSICCDIYIDGEEQRPNPKHGGKTKPLHVTAIMRGMHKAERPLPPGGAGEQQKKRGCSCFVLILCITAVVAVAVTVGVTVGMTKHKKKQPAVVLPNPQTGPALSASVTISVPFGASTKLEYPGGHNSLTCDDLFGDQQELEMFVEHLEAAHTRKLSRYQVDEVVVTELQCNNISFPVPAETYMAGKPAPAAAKAPQPQGASSHHRRLMGQQRRHRAHAKHMDVSSSSRHHIISVEEAGRPLVVYVELEAKRRDQQEKVPAISSYVEWLQAVSGAGSALASVLVPELLRTEFNLQQGLCEVVSVQQLNVEILSSQVVYDDLLETVTAHPGRKGYKGSTVVTRTELDPLTGMVTDSQTMRLPVLPDLIPELLPNLPSSSGPEQDGGSSGDDSSTSTDAAPDGQQQPQQGGTCGRCSLPNTASSTCVSGVCRVVTCEAGWQDCDGAPENGCEANVLNFFTDSNHCGSCNKVCLTPLTCQLGKCAIRTVSPQVIPVEQPPQQQPEQPEQQPEQQPAKEPQPASQQPPAQAPHSTKDQAEDKVKPPATEKQPTQTPPQEQPQVKPPGPETKPKPQPDTAKPEPKAPAASKPSSTPSKPKQEPKAPSAATTKPQEPPAASTQAPQKQPEQPKKEDEPEQPKPKPQQPVTPTAPAVPTKPAPAPAKPSAPAVVPAPAPKPQVKPVTPPTKPVTPPTVKPVAPAKPKPQHISLRDDVVRVSPSQEDVLLDVISNDDLRGANPADVKLSVVVQPATGKVTVVPAEGKNGRPKLLYVQGKEKLEPGAELEVFYTAAVPNQPTPSPATALLLGSAAPIDSSLSNCSAAAAATVPGTPITPLTRADDAAATVKLPFVVRMYGSKYSSAKISSNGWVSLGDSGAQEPCNVEGSWPGAPCLGTGPVLAPFWDDLVADQVLTRHDEALDAFVIQWSNMMAPAGKLPLGTFQAYLFPNGTVGYVYRDLYGTEQALGSSAVIGTRGPTTKATTHVNKLKSKELLEVGAGSDQHGMWLFSAHPDDSSDYVTTLSSHRRSLSPGLAMISHPSAATGVPGKFKHWAVEAGSSALPLLVSPEAPARPVLQALAVQAPQGNVRVATLSWEQSHVAHSSSVTFYKLYLAADPLFNELLRQPSVVAFKPDIPANSRSVDIELSDDHSAAEVYALLLACNDAACSRSCIGRYSLSS